ncbi:Hypp8399 [Branchiostoma lanceolatum]|uniref:Hypp8399 protein n=1 Tax=Branchiostoma lanceolatum TaxID=7740 RepID=A0A8K0EDD3_BRALA|nr:Hypp8399 [Branchiostoma lanceolatum]
MAKLSLYKAPKKNRKNPYTNRVGHGAEVMRQTYRVNDVTAEASLPASTHLLKEEYPLVEGFRDTVILASSKECSSPLPVPAMAECIQLHHIGEHWVVSTNKEGNTGITVYDSLYTTVGMSLRRQLVGLYKHHDSVDEGILPVTVICAQRQVGSSDCGLFAIANAVALAEGQCPTDVEFDQLKMRDHLDKCLMGKSLQMFPHFRNFQQSKSLQQSTYQLSIFCICHEYRQEAPMIQCDQCSNWLHYRCVNISAGDVAVLGATFLGITRTGHSYSLYYICI